MKTIPDFLSHLRRDRRGLPVPYANQWGDITLDRESIRFDPLVGCDAWFVDDDDETVPDFTTINPQRQRRCMVAGLCGICERPVPWSGRCLIVSKISVEAFTLSDGRTGRAIHEPWFHEQCARFAIKTCPALIGRRHDADLDLIRVRPPVCMMLDVARRRDGDGAHIAKYVKIVLNVGQTVAA